MTYRSGQERPLLHRVDTNTEASSARIAEDAGLARPMSDLAAS